MGFASSEKPTTGSRVRPPLKPINTGGGAEEQDEREGGSGGGGGGGGVPTTPTSEGSRIPARLACPPPPKKRQAGRVKKSGSESRCHDILTSNGKKEFFATPPDLEAVFIRRHVGC